MKNDIILVGAFSEVVELCLECGYNIIGYVDNMPFCGNAETGEYLGTDDDFISLYKSYLSIPIVISPDVPIVRERLYNRYRELGFNFQTVISPSAYISPSAQIGAGTVIQHGASISSNVIIGNLVKINVNANIMHDCVIDDLVTIAPNAVLLGKVKVSKRSYIGANATLLPKCSLLSDVIVGAGAVVTKDVAVNKIVKGVPAK